MIGKNVVKPVSIIVAQLNVLTLINALPGIILMLGICIAGWGIWKQNPRIAMTGIMLELVSLFFTCIMKG